MFKKEMIAMLLAGRAVDWGFLQQKLQNLP